MPTYEYECLKCHNRFERFQSMKDAPLKRCPKCRGKVKRLLGTGAGIIFKGSGFYATDYRSKSYTETARREKSAPAGEAKSSEKKTEASAPESKSKTKSETSVSSSARK